MLYDKLAAALHARTIDEIGLLPSSPGAAELPDDSREYLPLVVVDSKLGFPLTHLPTLLKEADTALRSATTSEAKSNASKIMVLLKPDHYTAWNLRKRMIVDHQLDAKEEVQLIDLIFTLPRHSKSCTAWHHRRWLHAQWPEMVDVDKELALCERTATLHPRNYYAWSYRGWLLDCLMDTPDKRQAEYWRSRAWIEQNVSDHSGVHHMARVMDAIGRVHLEGPHAHMDWLDELIMRFPGHEALWCHRRFCSTYFALDGHTFVGKAITAAQAACQGDPDLLRRQTELATRYGQWLSLAGMPSARREEYCSRLRETSYAGALNNK